MPGEQPTIFGDALRRLAAAATYLYQDGPRYWYSTQPTVTKLADDRAEQLKRDSDKVVQELDNRLREDLRVTGDFTRVHPMPQSGQDVPDDLDARLVVLGVDHPHSKETDSPAIASAKAILETRGNTPRLYRNTLAFLAADKTRLQDLDEAARKYLAWKSILEEKETLNLDPQQVKQAETQKTAANGSVTARLPETFQWLLVPGQGSSPQTPVTWEALRLSGQDALAVRASKKLRSDELLLTVFAPTRLRMELDRVPLWPNDHISIRQLTEYFARYLYLPRLSDSGVLRHAIQDGLALMTWDRESFAYADSYDEDTGRYRGLRYGQHVTITDGSPGLLVKPEVAQRQVEPEKPTHLTIVPPRPYLKPGAQVQLKATEVDDNGRMIAEPKISWTASGGNIDSAGVFIAGDVEGEYSVQAEGGSLRAEITVVISKADAPPPPPPPGPRPPKRFHGSVTLDSSRVGRDASRIADEVIAHLVGLVGSDVTVTLEIDADIPNGAPENVVRTVTENSRTLKFSSQGFEED
jgi:hypothetical protein